MNPILHHAITFFFTIVGLLLGWLDNYAFGNAHQNLITQVVVNKMLVIFKLIFEK